MDKPSPMQPIEFDPEGTLRFRENKIVSFLLDAGPYDLNKLIPMRRFDIRDWTQFAQLIGYSVDGFCDLSYVEKSAADEADKIASEMLKQQNQQYENKGKRMENVNLRALETAQVLIQGVILTQGPNTYLEKSLDAISAAIESFNSED